MTNLFTRYLRQALLYFFAIFAIFAMTGCAGNGGGMAPAGSFATTVTIVTHYGESIGVPEAYLDGGYIGSAGGWESGGGNCCVSMKTSSGEPMMVTVKWRTLRSNVGESRWHEETVPVHFAVPPGDGGGIDVHFLPGHHVQVWYSNFAWWSKKYPGPTYRRDPAPEYVPLPDEKPTPPEK